VGAVSVYALIGGSAIPKTETSGAAKSAETAVETVEEESAEETVTLVSQAAETWKKAGIEEYDLVLETVKATGKAKTTTKSEETEKTTTTKKETSETSATTTKAAVTEVKTSETTSAKETSAKSDESATEDVKSCSAMTMYTNDKVNMREGPTLDDSVIKVLAEDTEITVTGYTSDWYRIKYDGKTGYCMKRYATSEKPEAETETTEDVISYTSAEFDMLCYVLQGEVGDCSEGSKIAVANVIINRVKSSAFPDSIEGVLTQANQFTAVNNYYNGTSTPTANTIECAKRALGGEDNTNGAVYYYAPKYCSGSTASWFESLTFCMELDGQRFFK
jgi:spore germination cell wall hydrolase CwlJ-like protein